MRTVNVTGVVLFTLVACSSNPQSSVDAGSDSPTAGDAPSQHTLDINPKGAVLILDTANNPVMPVTQGYSAKLDGVDASSTTNFVLADSGYGSIAGTTFTSVLTLPGLAVAGTTHVQGSNAGAQASTSLTIIAVKASGSDPDAYGILPNGSPATSKTTIVKFTPDLGNVMAMADFQATLTNAMSNGTVDATALVASLAAMDQGDVTRGCPPRSAKDTDNDTVLDTFTGVISGSAICFKVTFKDNASVPAKPTVQVLQLVATAIAQPGAKKIQTKQVYVFVPPTP